VKLEALRLHYPAPGGAVRAVDGVDLELEAGETLALVGESGCGKSTLARAVVGLERPTSGRVIFAGTALEAFPAPSRRALSKRIQMVFQDPDASLNPRTTIERAVSEPLEIHERLTPQERERRVLELLERVGLDPALRYRYPHELSGGQRQRVCIARSLSVRPDLLVCDEAVSALDVSVQAQILNLLADLKHSFSLAYLFITHDLRVVRHVADRVAVMYLGQIVELAPTDELFERPRHPYTQALLASVPVVGGGPPKGRIRGEVPSPAKPPSGCRFQTRCPEVMERCRTALPPLYDLGTRKARCVLVESEAIAKDP
jgi:oligopeptide/dipeptide ABC transporter ATP-binding protein